LRIQQKVLVDNLGRTSTPIMCVSPSFCFVFGVDDDDVVDVIGDDVIDDDVDDNVFFLGGVE
jgi:hypothetical protein